MKKLMLTAVCAAAVMLGSISANAQEEMLPPPPPGHEMLPPPPPSLVPGIRVRALTGRNLTGKCTRSWPTVSPKI